MGKSIQDVMTSNPCAIDANQPVSYAAKMMKDEDVGLAPIVEGDRLVGALTDRDITVRVVAQADVAEEAKPKKVGELVEEISRD